MAVAAAASPLGPVAIPVAFGAALASFVIGKHKEADEAVPPSVIAEEEEGPSDADHGLKPNFVKFVVVTDQSTPIDHFLPGCGAKPLLDQQKDAIHLYSGNSVYQQMNQALRKDDQTGLKTYGSLINLTMQPFSFAAMQKPGSLLTPYVGTVWRGCQLPEFDRKKYKVGNVVLWEGFSSTSKTLDAAFGGNFRFEIHCNKCLMAAQTSGEGLHRNGVEIFVPAQIQHLSQYPNEDEVLYPPYTKFRVVSRIDGLLGVLKGVTVVMETMEFPCLNSLMQQGQWDKVQHGIAARSHSATKASPAWLTQHQEQEGSFLSQVAKKVVSEGATSGGLAVIPQLQGLGANPQKAHEILKAAMMDQYVPLPESHGKWYFDVGLMNADDKQLADRIHEEGGTTWQKYLARQATALEAWYLAGQKGQVQFTVMNNIGREVPYVVWKDETGQMLQKATGGGMIGNHRRVRRACPEKTSKSSKESSAKSGISEHK